MEGLLQPTSGKVRYRGRPLDRAYKQEVGIQFQSTSLQDFLTTRESLALFASFYSRSLPIEDIVRMCSLEGFLDQGTQQLSGGQRQRLFLALDLVNDPVLLVLDSPTYALNPSARQRCWRLIEHIQSQDKRVVLTTNYREEAYAICDEIAIMDRGKLIAQGTPQALLVEHFEGVWLDLPHEDFVPPADFPWKTLLLENAVSIHTTDLDGTLRYLMEKDVSLAGMRIKSPSLEDLFLELTGREIRA